MLPKLSIVVASRNDNHGGDMTRRMRLFINGLIHQCNKFNFPVELIMVEWNPPSSEPLLNEVLPKPKTGDKLTLRYIIVPEEIHRQYFHSRHIPLFQMIAKNVGIRRAKADFVLCSNIDLLFNDPLMQELSSKRLEERKFYRTNRCDIPKDVPEDRNVDEQLFWCKKNIIERHGFDYRHLNLINISHGWIYWFPAVSRSLNFLAGIIRPRLYPDQFPMLKIDYMACGDFTLMSKKDWMNIEGYVELDLYSIHIDSMALNACVASGMEQVIFPQELCTYHIYHEEGWASMNPLQLLPFLEKRPGLDWNAMYESGKYIIRNKTNYGFNKPDWGFANHQFEEITFNPFE